MKTILITIIITLFLNITAAQPVSQTNDNDLLHALIGNWQMSGHVMNKPVTYRAEGAWILSDNFFRFTMKDINEPSEYEARVFFGYDSAKTQYVVHWLDIFGGEYSKILGDGKVRSDTIKIFFSFRDRPFRDTIYLDDKGNTWTFLIEYKSPRGGWKEFARYTMKKSNK